ncbi:MAG: class I SAM-dependent methyltransferase [Planctomycetes bacterium]|nr:class I SAM-dependent methyltransferase [Planctomycetota bacterium]
MVLVTKQPPIRDAELYCERLLRTVPLFRAMVRTAECSLYAELELPEPTLDIGCGDGTFVEALRPAGSWTGIDLLPAKAREAGHRNAYQRVATADAKHLPFPDETFGSVVSNSTLEHIREVEPVLREIHRVLRPGGVIALTFPSELFYDYYLGTMMFEKLKLRPLARLYRRWVSWKAQVYHAEEPAVWRERLERLGFTVDHWRYYFSRKSTAITDAAHYFSAFSLITYALLGRWILWPGKVDVLPMANWIEPLSRPGDATEGSFLLFTGRK